MLSGGNMTNKNKKTNIKINYYYVITVEEGEKKVVDIGRNLHILNSIPEEKRILSDNDGNIQLKKINYDDENKRWELDFLKNGTDSNFKTTLGDNTETAEKLEDNEFIGYECCAIYDEESKILAIQNNKRSTSFNGIRRFLNHYLYREQLIEISPIVYKDEYSDISDDDSVIYKQLEFNIIDITKIRNLEKNSGEKSIMLLSSIANDFGALSAKIQLSVGRSNYKLDKGMLRGLKGFFKKNPDKIGNLKMRRYNGDEIRTIDLVNNKITDEITISTTKDDPKRFSKIIDAMNRRFNNSLDDIFKNCITFMNTNKK